MILKKKLLIILSLCLVLITAVTSSFASSEPIRTSKDFPDPVFPDRTFFVFEDPDGSTRLLQPRYSILELREKLGITDEREYFYSIVNRRNDPKPHLSFGLNYIDNGTKYFKFALFNQADWLNAMYKLVDGKWEFVQYTGDVVCPIADPLIYSSLDVYYPNGCEHLAEGTVFDESNDNLFFFNPIIRRVEEVPVLIHRVIMTILPISLIIFGTLLFLSLIKSKNLLQL